MWSTATLPIRMHLFRQKSENVIENNRGVIDGFFNLITFWFINVAGITIKCGIRRQTVGIFLPRAEPSFEVSVFEQRRCRSLFATG